MNCVVGLVLERKYGTAWHKPGCAVFKFDYWVKNASTDVTRRRGSIVGGSSRLGEDQRVISTEVDKPFILC